MFEYKCILTVDGIPDLNLKAKSENNICLRADLDSLAKAGWEIVSCVPVKTIGIYDNQVCWCTIAKREMETC